MQSHDRKREFIEPSEHGKSWDSLFKLGVTSYSVPKLFSLFFLVWFFVEGVSFPIDHFLAFAFGLRNGVLLRHAN